MEKAKKPRTYKGNHPSVAEQWRAAGEIEHDGVAWAVYARQQPHSLNWWTVKTVAATRAPRKGNFWWTINLKTGQVGFSRDRQTMQSNNPGLLTKVEKAIRELHHNKCLTSPTTRAMIDLEA